MTVLEYIDHISDNPEDAYMTFDGLDSEGLHYLVVQKSDGLILRETIWHLDDRTLYVGNDCGTIAELHSNGYTWEQLFPAALEAISRVRPIDVEF